MHLMQASQLSVYLSSNAYYSWFCSAFVYIFLHFVVREISFSVKDAAVCYVVVVCFLLLRMMLD